MKEFRKFLRFLRVSARGQLVGAVGLATLLSLTEGVSLAMILPLIALFGNAGRASAATASAGPHTRLLFRLLAQSHLPPGEWLAALLLVVLVSVALLAQLNGMLSTLTTGIILRVRERLAAEIYRAILHGDWNFLTRRRSSDLTHFLTGELPRVGMLAAGVISLLANGMVALLMLGVALYLAPLLTLLVLAGLLLLLPWQRRVGRAIFHAGDQISLNMRGVFQSSMDRLQNLKAVKAYGAQDAELKVFTSRYHAVVQELLDNEWRSIAASRRFQLVSTALLCALILLGLGPLHLSAGTMLIFLFAFLRAAPRLSALQGKVNEILAELPAYRRIDAFLAECELHTERDGLSPAPRLRRELRLEGIRFRYSETTRLVLDDLGLTLAAGRITALAGASGSGKSTIADIVMGLLKPDTGSILADGARLTSDSARAWRREIGYVSQDTLLFHASIRENLLWARPDASETELNDALQAASAGFAGGLAHGLDTVIGDRGMMLSHGQRQRVALARALLLKPALLILDEATNSLDLENEENILRTVQRSGVTTLLISHRPSAVKIADAVYVLEGGKVTLSEGWVHVREAVETQPAGAATEGADVTGSAGWAGDSMV